MSSNLPLVSVIVIVRIEEKFISETIHNILNQDYINIEVVVKDACSTDDTLKILKKYPVKVISQPDAGQANAANTAAKLCNGEFLIFEGGDDLLKPKAISIMVEAFQKNHNAGFVYGDVDIINDEGKIYSTLKGKPFDFDELFIFNFIPSQAVMLRRSAFEEVGGYDENLIIADWDLRIRMGARNPPIYIPKTLASYRIHNGSTTLNNLIKVAQELNSIPNNLIKDQSVLTALKKTPNRALAGAYILSAMSFMRGHAIAISWKMYVLALVKYPFVFFKKQSLVALSALFMGPRRFNQFIERRRLKPKSTIVRFLGLISDSVKHLRGLDIF
jgi:glycosyltransferase involved in cell wall biosynthesis